RGERASSVSESGWERELRERLHEVFVAEAVERLAALDAALLALEGGAAQGDAGGLHLPPQGDAGGLHLPPQGDAAHHLSEAFRQAHTLKGGARAAGLPEVERVAHGLESAFEGLRKGSPGGPDTWGAIYAGVDALRNLVGGRAADASAPGAPGAGNRDDGLALIDDMGRLRSRLDADLRRLEHVAGDIHDSVRRLRMVPVGVALAGLPRLVRDTAAACGKQARLELVGDRTEVDRSVLEGISGALTHLVRNAVDHGLEEPQRRALAGKPSVGTVTVR